jgi:TolB protein
MKRFFLTALASACALLVLTAQDATLTVSKGTMPKLALPEFRGTGDALRFMAAFNDTLNRDLADSGYVEIRPRTSYPVFVPQQPADFQTPAPSAPARRGGAPVLPQPGGGGGRWMLDWSGAPVQADDLAYGYTAAQNGVFVLQGYLSDLHKESAAPLIAKRYAGGVDEAGARKVAHEFAADIITLFGGMPLFNTHIYFTSNRTGHKEIWVMDPDGGNQRQITRFNSDTTFASVSPDGSKIAFTSWVRIQPAIFVFSVDPVRDLRFYNQSASVNGTPSFTSDGKQIVYASSSGSPCCRIFRANLDGSGFRPVAPYSSIDMEPKVNPKTGTDIVFTSGRSGAHQVYRMNMDGSDVERLTPGVGEAGNPAWNPNGHLIAFAWTQGFSTGAFNVFWMDVASPGKYNQLTHGEGKNENPSWSPDGTRIVFGSTRRGKSQIYSMLADGSRVQRLTEVGENSSPAWGK